MTSEEEPMASVHFKQVLKLLSEDKVQEAISYHEGEFLEAIADLEREHETCEEMIEVASAGVKLPAGKSKLVVKRQPKFKSRLSKQQRRDLIKETAYNLAKATGGKVSVREIAAKIEEGGFDLRSKVPGTMIGNFLMQASNEWQRIEKGIFKYVGAAKAT